MTAVVKQIWMFAVLIVGLLTVTVAAQTASETADHDVEMLTAMDSVVTTIVPLLPYAIFIIAAFAMIGFAAYLKNGTAGGIR